MKILNAINILFEKENINVLSFVINKEVKSLIFELENNILEILYFKDVKHNQDNFAISKIDNDGRNPLYIEEKKIGKLSEKSKNILSVFNKLTMIDEIINN